MRLEEYLKEQEDEIKYIATVTLGDKKEAHNNFHFSDRSPYLKKMRMIKGARVADTTFDQKREGITWVVQLKDDKALNDLKKIRELAIKNLLNVETYHSYGGKGLPRL